MRLLRIIRTLHATNRRRDTAEAAALFLLGEYHRNKHLGRNVALKNLRNSLKGRTTSLVFTFEKALG
jgi:hypothetical protein